jgi:hypothetical protein
MPDPLRSAAIFATAALLGSSPGPRKTRYAICLDTGLFYKFIPDDATATNGITILGQVGGYPGTWQHVAGDQLGADLDDSDAAITVAGKLERFLPTLTRNCTKTLGTAGAVNGAKLVITVTSGAGFTVAFVNGGPGVGTLTTKPSGQKWWFEFRFNGTDWRLFRAGQLV